MEELWKVYFDLDIEVLARSGQWGQWRHDRGRMSVFFPGCKLWGDINGGVRWHP